MALEIPLDQVPELQTYTQGLAGELSFLEIIAYVFKINFFNLKKVPNQPEFFISNRSWELLANGESLNEHDKTIPWFNTNYRNHEIYAFVFCLAFAKTGAYFRVRTIIREKGDRRNPLSRSSPLIVETENIAYVDLGTASRNRGLSLENQATCLKFIIPSNDNWLKQEIDSQVYSTKQFLLREQATSLEQKEKGVTERNTALRIQLNSLPSSFVDSVLVDAYDKGKQLSPKQIENILLPIKNEGAIFGKERIINIIRNPKYRDVKGTLIKLAWNPFRNTLNYFFAVNPNFATENMPCPPPSQACQ
jgi:hypothetical protein